MNLLATAVVTCLSIAAPLHAQGPGRYGISGDEGRFYAGGAAVWERMPELPGGGATWSLAFGADITERLGLRVVFEPTRDARGFEDIFTLSSRALPTRVTHRETQSLQTWALMGDWRWRLSTRMRVAVIYGVAIVDGSRRVVREEEETQPDGTTVTRSITRRPESHERLGAPVAGVELPISLGHLEVVPDVRVIYMLNPESVEPFVTRLGVGVRWALLKSGLFARSA